MRFLLSVPILVLVLAFGTSCISKEYPATETYYETEYRTEYYTVIETMTDTVSGEEMLVSKKDVVNFWSPEQDCKSYHWGYRASACKYRQIEYELPRHDGSELELVLYNPTGTILFSVSGCPNAYEDFFQSRTGIILEAGQRKTLRCTTPAQKVAVVMGRGPRGDWSDCYVYYCNNAQYEVVKVDAKLKWCDYIKTEKEVTKQRQVPYQAEKQRTVMKTKKVPIWELLFPNE